MQISELIEQLQKFPGHYTVEIFQDVAAASAELTAEIDRVSNDALEKIVRLEIGHLLHD